MSEKSKSTNNVLGNEPINSSTPTTNKIVSFLGRKSANTFNPIKSTTSANTQPPLTRMQKLVLNIGKMWNDSFGRRVIAFTVLFVGSAYFVAVPKFNTYIKNSQQDDDDDEDEE